jgi:hypothetical protein
MPRKSKKKSYRSSSAWPPCPAGALFQAFRVSWFTVPRGFRLQDGARTYKEAHTRMADPRYHGDRGGNELTPQIFRGFPARPPGFCASSAILHAAACVRRNDVL